MKLDNDENMQHFGRNDAFKCRTRMKKVAPPPPVASTSKLTNGDLLRRPESEAPPHRPPMSCTPGEDCAFDELLEGRMDLEVVLPDRRAVRITVDRRTPMMDLLVHVTTSNKLTPSNHIIKVLSEEQHNVLYKPNTPIGSLDVNTVYLVPKSSVDLPVKRMPKLANQPFEQTFRLQVNLPRNQRMVLRVSPRITLAELKRQICNEKELDHSNHHLVHPAQPDTVLDLNSTLDSYGCAEISLLSNSGLRDSIHSISSQFIAYPRVVDEEKKKKGILRLFSKRRKETTVESSSNGVNSQGISTGRSDTLTREGYHPKQSTKRKQAPAPPVQSSSPPFVIHSSSSLNSRPESEISAKTDELGSTVSHSRHSSDSSGYHEPSVFSDCSENKSPEASIVHGGSAHEASTFCKDIPDCLNLTKPARDSSNLKSVPSCSNTSIVSAARKRKAPQPPPPTSLPEVESPSPEDRASPELSVPSPITEDPEEPTANQGGELERDSRARESIAVKEPDLGMDANAAHGVSQQESEALEYFENVLQESETLEPNKRSCDSSEDAKPQAEESEPESRRLLERDSPIPKESDTMGHSVAESVPIIDSVASSASDVVSDSENSKPGDVSAVLSNTPESEKTSTDSDYYADLSSTSTDASEIPPVPLKKDILLNDETVAPSVSQTAFNECVATEIKDECVDCIIETPSVPKDCRSVDKISESSAISKSKETEFDYMDHCVLSSENKMTSKSKASQKNLENQNLGSEDITPTSRRKLINFAMGCYKSEVMDIYEDEYPPASVRNVKSKDERVLRHEFQAEVQVHAEPSYHRQAPNVKIIPFEERDLCDKDDISVSDNIKGQVKQRCSELSSISTLPLTGRSASLYNLSPQNTTTRFKPLSQSTAMETASFMKRTQSDQNISQESTVQEEKSEFVDEQKRLHDEYLKLQVQFINWQKQLLNNQALLQTEQILPQITFPALEQYKIELEKLPMTLQDNMCAGQDEEDFKTRSLPRPKSRPLSVKQQNRSETPPSMSRNCKSEETIEASTNLKHEKAVMSDSGISTEETSDHSNIPSETNEDAAEFGQASKCQTLPRSVNRPTSALETSKTMTLNRQARPKSQMVSVTIGSWQERNMTASDINSAAVASSRSMFQSLENLPRDHNKSTPPVPMQRKKTKALNVAKVEDKTDNFEITPEPNGSATPGESIKKPAETRNAPEAVQRPQELVEKPVFKKPEPVRQRSKVDPKSPTTESVAQKKLTKPFLRLSSMKDEPPPALHVLKKWPLPEINEKRDPKKSAEQSFWDEITASAKRPTGRSREKVTHAEVDLRRHRSAKSDPSSNTTRNKYPEEGASKVHITKVNIYNSSNSNSSKSSSNDSAKHRPQRSSSAAPLTSSAPCHSEPFNAELRNVLSKRASALAEPQETQGSLVEPTYAEAQNGHAEVKEASPAQNSSPPPPPPPPVSTMPAIPPAAPIPKSSQLLMEKRTVGSTAKKQHVSQPKTTSSIAPREELMLEIRGFGGRQALRKVPIAQPGWHMKVYGSASAVNS